MSVQADQRDRAAELVRAGAVDRVFQDSAGRADDLRGEVSTYARCGIIVNVTPFEPEWEGFVTLGNLEHDAAACEDLRERGALPDTCSFSRTRCAK